MNILELSQINVSDYVEFESEEERESFMEQAGEELLTRIINHSQGLLDGEPLAQLEGLLGQDQVDMVEIYAFLLDQIPIFPDIVAEETLNLKTDLLEAAVKD